MRFSAGTFRRASVAAYSSALWLTGTWPTLEPEANHRPATFYAATWREPCDQLIYWGTLHRNAQPSGSRTTSGASCAVPGGKALEAADF